MHTEGTARSPDGEGQGGWAASLGSFVNNEWHNCLNPPTTNWGVSRHATQSTSRAVADLLVAHGGDRSLSCLYVSVSRNGLKTLNCNCGQRSKSPLWRICQGKLREGFQKRMPSCRLSCSQGRELILGNCSLAGGRAGPAHSRNSLL